ncbi:MAG: outer membrane beta-barrel protein [Terriglobia bacterium]
MRKIAWLIVVIFFSATTTQAQDTYPRVEVFAGYSYADVKLSGFRGVPRTHGHGWATSFTYNLHKHFGLTADFAGQYGTVTEHAFSEVTQRTEARDLEFNAHQFLFGPRFTLRRDRLTAFAHTLVGAFRRWKAGFGPSGIFVPMPASFPGLSGTHFSLALGGGLDIRSNNRVSIRVIQFDYLPVQGGLDSERWRHNLRLQTGFVFKFGVS